MNTRSVSALARGSFARGALLAACLLTTAASAAPPGDVLWEDVLGDSPTGDTARAVDARDGRVFVAGEVQSSAPGILTMRAYAARSGRLLWSAKPGTGGNDEAHGVHAFANVVAVCGVFEIDSRAIFGVIAYDPATGQEAWRDTATDGDARACEGQPQFRHSRDREAKFAHQQAAQGNLYVVGTVFGEATGPDVLVRAYDARTGVVLWQDRFDGGGNVADLGNAVDIQDGQVYVTGVVQQTPGNEDLFVRRYDGATGALAWQQLYAGPGGERDDGQTIAATANRVFVGGFASQVAGADGSAVIALRADTGGRLWSDFHEAEVVNAIGARAGHVIAASGPQVEGTNAIVRAYDARSGRLEWARSEGASGGALTIDTDDEYAYWGGFLEATGSGTDLFVQAVHIETGQTAWEDIRENGRPYELVVDDRTLFVAGSTGDNGDFLVRALRAR